MPNKILRKSVVAILFEVVCCTFLIIDKNGQYWMVMHGNAPEFPPTQTDKSEKERYTFQIPLYWNKNDSPNFEVNKIQKKRAQMKTSVGA